MYPLNVVPHLRLNPLVTPSAILDLGPGDAMHFLTDLDYAVPVSDSASTILLLGIALLMLELFRRYFAKPLAIRSLTSESLTKVLRSIFFRKK